MVRALQMETVKLDHEVSRPAFVKVSATVKQTANAAIWARLSEMDDYTPSEN